MSKRKTITLKIESREFIFEAGQGFVRTKRASVSKNHIIRNDGHVPESFCGKKFYYPINSYIDEKEDGTLHIPVSIEDCCLDAYILEQDADDNSIIYPCDCGICMYRMRARGGREIMGIRNYFRKRKQRKEIQKILSESTQGRCIMNNITIEWIFALLCGMWITVMKILDELIKLNRKEEEVK